MEKIENIKKNIKENLVRYRKNAGLTQAQLAEKLGYSDKTISKWEREEGVPDIYILKEIADLYGVTVNDLITPAPSLLAKIKDKAKEKLSNRNKVIIALLATGLVWLVATTLNIVFDIVHIWDNLDNIYIYAIPLSFIVLIIFNSVWGKRFYNLFLISGLIWTVTLSLYVTLLADNLYKIFFIPIPLQAITILWFLMDKNK